MSSLLVTTPSASPGHGAGGARGGVAIEVGGTTCNLGDAEASRAASKRRKLGMMPPRRRLEGKGLHPAGRDHVAWKGSEFLKGRTGSIILPLKSPPLSLPSVSLSLAR